MSLGSFIILGCPRLPRWSLGMSALPQPQLPPWTVSTTRFPRRGLVLVAILLLPNLLDETNDNDPRPKCHNRLSNDAQEFGQQSTCEVLLQGFLRFEQGVHE